MSSARLYHGRKVRGVCTRCGILPPRPLTLECADCALSEAERKAAWARANPARVQAATRRYWDRHHPPTGPNQVACCGAWRTIETIPCRLACCGRVLALVEEPAHG